jgi:catechol-2,3-dioxygenase
MSRPGLTFTHMGMFVTDIHKMTDFYARVLEFTVTDRGQLQAANGGGLVDFVFLSRDPDEHHQIVMVSGRPATLSFNPINQISLRADSLATLKAMSERIAREITWEMFPCTHGNSLSVYVPDPEGNRLELYFDLPWYVEQPARVPVDLSGSVESIMAAAEAYARLQPGFEPRAQWRRRMAERMGIAYAEQDL